MSLGKKRVLIVVAFFMMFIAMGASQAYAIEYQTLAPIQSGSGDFVTDKVAISDGGLSDYLNAMYRLGIALCGGLAVLMIVIGGVQYVSSDAWSKKDDGKKRINAAILGLLVVLGSYALLKTLNPALLDTTLKNLGEVTADGIANTENGGTPGSTTGGTQNNGGTGSTGTGGGTGTPDSRSEDDLRKYFADNGISINSGPCTGGQTSGCSNVAGLGEDAVNGLIDLEKKTGPLTISGGTEDGHQTHGVGKSIVDVRHNDALDNYILTNKVGEPRQTSLGPVYTLPDGSTYMNETSGGDHWHIVFK